MNRPAGGLEPSLAPVARSVFRNLGDMAPVSLPRECPASHRCVDRRARLTIWPRFPAASTGRHTAHAPLTPFTIPEFSRTPTPFIFVIFHPAWSRPFVVRTCPAHLSVLDPPGDRRAFPSRPFLDEPDLLFAISEACHTSVDEPPAAFSGPPWTSSRTPSRPGRRAFATCRSRRIFAIFVAPIVSGACPLALATRGGLAAAWISMYARQSVWGKVERERSPVAKNSSILGPLAATSVIHLALCPRSNAGGFAVHRRRVRL